MSNLWPRIEPLLARVEKPARYIGMERGSLRPEHHPDKVAWLATQMLKTRVAHGYCSRHEGQGACEYANICETCDNYTPATEFAAALTDQLADIQALQADADRRGWTSEAQRHDRVAKALQGHLDRLP